MPKVLLLEDNNDLSQMVCQVFKIRTNFDCLPFRSLAELKKDSISALDCAVAVIDINLGSGKPSGFDAYRYLKDLGFTGQTIFVTAQEISHPLMRKAGLAGIRVLRKPVETATLCRLVEELVLH